MIATISDIDHVHPPFSCSARTRALLFQGANPGVNLLPSLLNGSSELPAECSSQPKQNGASPSKGGLMKYFSNGSTAGSDRGKPIKSAAQAELCVCCHSIKGVQPGCSFCDRRVCSGCLEVCCVCEGVFCQFCSVRKWVDLPGIGSYHWCKVVVEGWYLHILRQV